MATFWWVDFGGSLWRESRPDSPPLSKGDIVFIERGTAARHEELL